MSAHSPRNIRVEPAGTFTSRNRAARFVRHGHAEWTDSTFSAIRFFPRFAGANLTSLAAPWRACYRTAEAAVLPPSVDWLKQNYPVFTTESD